LTSHVRIVSYTASFAVTSDGATTRSTPLCPAPDLGNGLSVFI